MSLSPQLWTKCKYDSAASYLSPKARKYSLKVFVNLHPCLYPAPTPQNSDTKERRTAISRAGLDPLRCACAGLSYCFRRFWFCFTQCVADYCRNYCEMPGTSCAITGCPAYKSRHKGLLFFRIRKLDNQDGKNFCESCESLSF